VLNATSITLQQSGDRFTIQAKGTDANNNDVKGLPVTFSSANPTVAAATPFGVVEAVNQGTTTVTVAIGGFKVDVPVTVLHATAPKKR
jgi:hypothetical protein